jgi:hypothetical protein
MEIGPVMDLSLENNAFPAALMDLFQKKSSRLIKLIVTACPNLSWHYGIIFGQMELNFRHINFLGSIKKWQFLHKE